MAQMHWLNSARESIAAAQSAIKEFPRSAVSRAYFAAYAATHAILLHSNETPPQRGNWAHGGLGQQLATVLARGAGLDRRIALLMRKCVDDCYNCRIQADYGPHLVMGEPIARSATRHARQVLLLAERMVL